MCRSCEDTYLASFIVTKAIPQSDAIVLSLDVSLSSPMKRRRKDIVISSGVLPVMRTQCIGIALSSPMNIRAFSQVNPVSLIFWLGRR